MVVVYVLDLFLKGGAWSELKDYVCFNMDAAIFCIDINTLFLSAG